MSINAAQLAADKTIIVRGKVAFSHIASQYTGAELDRRVKAQRERGSLYPTDTPHTVLSLTDAQIVPQSQSGLSIEEQFVQEKFYVSKSGENAGKTGFQIEDKSNYLPVVFAKGEDNQYARIEKLQGELDNGLDVTIVLRTFQSGSYANKGVGLQQVLVNEDIRYYARGGVDAGALAAIGVVLTGSTAATPVSEGIQSDSADDAAPAAPNTVVENGYAAPAAPTAPAATDVPQGQQAFLPAEQAAAPAAPAAPAPAAVPAPAAQGQSPFDAAPAAAASNESAERAALLAKLAELDSIS